MFSILAAGIALWAIYGMLKTDYVIILANSISLCLLAGILYFKIRERSKAVADGCPCFGDHRDSSG